MSFADIRIVAIVLVLASTYGIWLFEYSSQTTSSIQNPGMPGQNYTEPSSSSFFGTINNAVKINVQNPEIFFINSILFITLALLVVFVGLRYLRGTG